MSMSTRESMRAELKELAKMAETMGKAPAAEAVDDRPLAFPENALERPPTPASASRVSVPPFATPTTPPVFDYAEPKKGGKRTGVHCGHGRRQPSLPPSSEEPRSASLSRALPAPVAPITAAAAIAPQAEVALPAAVSAPPPAAVAPPPVAGSGRPRPGCRRAKELSQRPERPGSPQALGQARRRSPRRRRRQARDGERAGREHRQRRPRRARAQGGSGGRQARKPAAAAAGGGTDSLEDLIRKEVADQKK